MAGQGPIEPPASTWAFPSARSADGNGVVGVGADVDPGTLLAAYRRGLFPMPMEVGGPMAWWSPDPRGVLDPGGMRISRSLRRSMDRFEVRIDTAFDEVVAACADPASRTRVKVKVRRKKKPPQHRATPTPRTATPVAMSLAR